MMVIESIKNIKSTRAEFRKFGIASGIALGILGGWFLLREKDYYFYFLILSFVFLFLGLVAPTLLKRIQKIWMSIALLISWFLTKVILVVLFYLVVTPIGILVRMFGKGLLDIRFDRNADSYWIAREPGKLDKRSYENQF